MENHSEYDESKPAIRKYNHDDWFTDQEKEKLMEEINPYGVPKDQLALYMFTPNIRESVDLTKKSDVRSLRMLLKLAKRNNPHITYGQGCS
ncbi:MAG: hypothetical protein ACRDA4_08725 [Filifactoraceae bacterium]